MFRVANYRRPNVVFWNLNGQKTTFPVTQNEEGVCLVSGFSADLLKLFLSGGAISPLGIMLEAVQPYHCEVDASEK